MRAYLERIDCERRMARFYAVIVQPTLLGEWAVIREWGRIGQGGTVRKTVHDCEADAQRSAWETVAGKQRRGYRLRS